MAMPFMYPPVVQEILLHSSKQLPPRELDGKSTTICRSIHGADASETQQEEHDDLVSLFDLSDHVRLY